MYMYHILSLSTHTPQIYPSLQSIRTPSPTTTWTHHVDHHRTPATTTAISDRLYRHPSISYHHNFRF
ncbi:hypothetical protein HanIR_Chr15g0753351 [Helianthus annuus]|nr:hypothetical protein HanIR_Chr15g0753351 [Helianthus annuus]